MKTLMTMLLLTAISLAGFSQTAIQSGVQCKGVTSKKIQCKNFTKNASGYCYLHQSQFKPVAPPSTFECGQAVVDSRDGKTYPTVQIGNQCWFQVSLNYGTMGATKYCYNDNEDHCSSYGALYSWSMAMDGQTSAKSKGICPEGWHIPDSTECYTLFNFLGGQSLADYKLKAMGDYWEPSRTTCTHHPTNESGFTAIPTGTRYSTGAYNYFPGTAAWWTSSYVDSSVPPKEAARYFGVRYCTTGTTFGQWYVNPSMAQSAGVRCIKN